MKYRVATSRRRKRQGGFILLVIFIMAAAVAIMMYQQLPRVAFESERDKEQLLIERGKEYIRAVDLYSKANGGNLPQTIDDLERGNGKRFLRRKFIDPYTGKDEWRLIHSNGGQLTDSLVTPPPATNGSSSSSTSSTSTSTSNQQLVSQVNDTMNLRPSDVTLPGADSFNGRTGNGNPQPLPNAPGAPPQLAPNGQPLPPGVPGQPNAGQPGFGIPGVGLPGGQIAGNQQTKGVPPPVGPGGFVPQFVGQQFAGQTPPPGAQMIPPPAGFRFNASGQLEAVPATNATPGGATTTPDLPRGLNTASNVGLPGGLGTNAAVAAINQILTNPRQGAGASTGGGGQGGIIGVASTHTGASIAIYKDRQKYEEWEFIAENAGKGGGGGAGGGAVGGNNNGKNNGKNNGNNNGKNNGNNGFNNNGNNGFNNNGNNGFNNNGNNGFNNGGNGRGGNGGGGGGGGGVGRGR